jgi:hypothetical protein
MSSTGGRKEDEKKHTTDCVSMLSLRNDGTINLAMGLEKGTWISKQLYSEKNPMRLFLYGLFDILSSGNIQYRA